MRGEIVKLTVRLENRKSERIGKYTGVVPGENTGIRFYVSGDGGSSYGEYHNPQWVWNRADRYIQIEPSASVEETFDIFWNSKPDVAGRSPLNIAEVTRGKILTEYAFPLPGAYFVKVAVWNLKDANWRQLPNLESQPIEIVVVEPRGDDLEVWRLIERRPDLAYFIQNAWFSSHDNPTRERLWREMRGIADRYPNSVIARQIGEKLQAFRTRYRGRPLPWDSPN